MSHISYSELKVWAECPFKHKLNYVDKIRKFIGNEYTAFGRSLHSLCEHMVQDQISEEHYDDFSSLLSNCEKLTRDDAGVFYCEG